MWFVWPILNIYFKINNVLKITVSLHCLQYESTEVSNGDLPDTSYCSDESSPSCLTLHYIHLLFSFLTVKTITTNIFSLEMNGCMLWQNFHLKDKLIFQVNSKFKVENPLVWSWSYIRDILAGKKNHGFSYHVSHISSNYFHSQLPNSRKKLQGGSLGWRIQWFCSLISAAVKERNRNKTARIAERRDEDRWDCLVMGSIRWVERAWRNKCFKEWLKTGRGNSLKRRQM